ncbi:prolyl oligopeptidase family serine peptidase [Advenella mimigardefordensis]|uniref:Protease 2 n=1 Tax=Advenella mimigardefordensis (strain DSM 17166 / LMG 22922 / DPN7) TaxID=1247726 RepID=W0PHQ4_ADVMD|nr:prolyl oligopeptidase family serine peptidase [Advenella mimigardefordensis]AHG65302.1 protease 2 [Advenella mimigardefordensis DPN7]
MRIVLFAIVCCVVGLGVSGAFSPDDQALLQSAASLVAAQQREENQRVERYLASEKQLGRQLAAEMHARRQQGQRPETWTVNGIEYRKQRHGRHITIERFDASHKHWLPVIDSRTRTGTGEQQNGVSLTTSFYVMRTPVISPDNRYALLPEAFVDDDLYRVSVWDIEAGRQIDQASHQSVGELVWAGDSRSFYYIQAGQNGGASALIWHQVPGAETTSQPVGATERQVYQAVSHASGLSIAAASSGRYLILTEDTGAGTDVKLIDLSSATPFLLTLDGLKPQADNLVDHAADGFYMRSNQDGRFALYLAQDRRGYWKKIYTPDASAHVEGFQVLRDWVILRIQEQGVSALRYWHKGDRQRVRQVPFPDHRYKVWMPTGSSGNVLVLGYTSPTVPPVRVSFDMAREQWLTDWPKEQQAYQTRYLHIPVRDGVKIPVTLIWRTSDTPEAGAPLLVTGYGAYGFSLSPVYGTSYKSLLDRGFVYAMIHVRGGGELGEEWHAQGRGRNKKNSFNDFVDVTRHLQRRFHAYDRTYAMGESAGGLLVAASMIQAPSLYSGVILQVPFLDVSGVMAQDQPRFGELERAEWGRPGNSDDLAYIDSYSPSRTVASTCYPPILMIAAAHDARTPSREARDFLGQLRNNKCNENSTFLFTEPDAGHAGSVDRVARNIMSYQFILKLDRMNRRQQVQE